MSGFASETKDVRRAINPRQAMLFSAQPSEDVCRNVPCAMRRCALEVEARAENATGAARERERIFRPDRPRPWGLRERTRRRDAVAARAGTRTLGAGRAGDARRLPTLYTGAAYDISPTIYTNRIR